ncbi:hypothetical protein BKA62DRAFT_704006 [Auriculariales sp. MPI-PUGE-AT-0066]|nr:hypothetical protein BKA62DRAFT_704006 [Auriculariales sp. MPI-PUGE-AT-0066]
MMDIDQLPGLEEQAVTLPGSMPNGLAISSAEDGQEAQTFSSFKNYQSIFGRYASLNLLLSDTDVNDARRQQAARAITTLDPNSKICQYEVPGGGVCKDATCKDVHLNRT